MNARRGLVRGFVGSSWGRALGSLLGIMLVVVLLGWLWLSHRDGFFGALAAVRHADAVVLVAVVLLPLCNWSATAVFFWAITRRAGPVGLGEMHAVIGAAGVLNYAPMRPGMVARIAYHKRVNGIAVKASLRILVLSIAISAAALAILLLVAMTLAGFGSAWVYTGAIVPIPVLAAAAFVLGSQQAAGAWLLAGAARYADMLCWAVRYQVVFAAVGEPVGPAGAVALAAASQAATLVPLAGNGLGLREAAIGLCAAALPGVADPGEAAAIGVTADLVNRAAELLALVPVGLVSLWLVRGRLRRASAARAQAEADAAARADREGSASGSSPVSR